MSSQAASIRVDMGRQKSSMETDGTVGGKNVEYAE